ncbi:MAG: hypothetical protein MUC42_14800 [Bryobacter sp.]|nr:hypothetical protein [Bryobacter sp.]
MKTLLFVAAGAILLYAVETKTWTQAEEADFAKGTLKGLSLRSDGRVSLAPALKEIADASAPYLWAVVEDSKGTVYAGGGGPGSSAPALLAINAAGAARKIEGLEGAAVQALAVDAQDRLYAATSPDGKVWRIAGANKPEVFYDPKAKYIWALAFDGQGRLYVATGDPGEIHQVQPNGTGKVLFKLEEAHARSLAIDAQGRLHVGTEPGGLVIRVSPAGEGFVLYQTSKREVTALGFAPSGDLYAAAVGNRTAPSVPLPAPAPAPTAQQQPNAVTLSAANPMAQQRPATAPPTVGFGMPAVAGGSEVVRIDKEGAPEKVWSSTTEIVYAIAFDKDGKPVLGTGNKGELFRIDSPRLSTKLLSLAPTQVTALAAARAGGLVAATGNVGKVFRLGPALEKEGTLESEVFDAGSFTYWGRLRQESDNGAALIETRSGNLDRPQKNWSSWSPLKDGRITSPAARFLQYRATLRPAASGTSPELRLVEAAWQAKNLAPRVEEVDITPPNYKFPAPSSLSFASSSTITLRPLGRKQPATPATLSIDTSSANSMNSAKGHLGARWLAVDDNGDAMLSTIEIRGSSEAGWKMLKEKLREKSYSWDSTAFPDGWYRVRITVSDAPDNPAGQELTAQLERAIS